MRRSRRTSWAPPELVALALLATVVFYAVGSIVNNLGELDNPPFGGWRTTIAFWTSWATEPWLPVLLLLSSLVSWQTAKTCRDCLFEAAEFEDSGTEEEESEGADTPSAVQTWDRARRVLIITGVAALLGGIACLAVILLVVDDELPGVRSAFLSAIPNLPESALAWGRVSAAFSGFASLVPALTTVVVFWYVRRIWVELTYSDNSIDDEADVPS